ncbi:hypothetical protein [uncultured Chryseobacterium sp.]|uniref:hypothetical protein n=1 Tax=uncultured Chryseobacterium sp. TaxID=259322 RepID=UPI0025EF239F|nr:hypothetical protein [uncultured Chryseobacterium sp.]
MNKLLIFTFLAFSSAVYSQTTVFGVIPGLAFHKNDIQNTIQPTDTIIGKLMNFNLIKNSSPGVFFKKLDISLSQSSLFFVTNKFGGAGKKVYGKIGSTIVSNRGVDDFSDSLRINTGKASSKILTFTKRDTGKKINPIIFLTKKNDPDLLIPEILVFDNNLSPINLQKVETYLSVKYGITINDISEKNYIASSDDIIWDSKKNKNYNFRITGIGRDDAFGLYQKQSKNSDDDHIVMALDSLKLTNVFNTGQLQNSSFVLWGDNNQELKFKEADLLSQHPKRDMARLWKVQAKKANNIPLVANLYLTLSGLTQNDHIKLRIFNSEANYQSDFSTDISGNKINDSLFIFKNVLWDPDGNGTDYFTFNVTNPESEADIKMISSCEDLGNNIIKISVPDYLYPFTYSVKSISTGQEIIPVSTANNNLITLNNLAQENYKIMIHRQGHPDIIRTFNLEGMISQNIDDHYLWAGSPIELDLNTNTYQYTLVSPSGLNTTAAPYLLNGAGSYQLKIKNKAGCEITKTLSVLNPDDFRTLQSNSLFKKITVSPNPSHDGNLVIHVELKAAKPVTVKIFNGLGVLLKQGQYNAATDFIIPMNIPPMVGYYNIKIFIPEEGKGVNFLIN